MGGASRTMGRVGFPVMAGLVPAIHVLLVLTRFIL
jgi:hypothetical protein